MTVFKLGGLTSTILMFTWNISQSILHVVFFENANLRQWHLTLRMMAFLPDRKWKARHAKKPPLDVHGILTRYLSSNSLFLASVPKIGSENQLLISIWSVTDAFILIRWSSLMDLKWEIKALCYFKPPAAGKVFFFKSKECSRNARCFEFCDKICFRHRKNTLLTSLWEKRLEFFARHGFQLSPCSPECGERRRTCALLGT